MFFQIGKQRKAFTFIETLVSFVLMGILIQTWASYFTLTWTHFQEGRFWDETLNEHQNFEKSMVQDLKKLDTGCNPLQKDGVFEKNNRTIIHLSYLLKEGEIFEKDQKNFPNCESLLPSLKQWEIEEDFKNDLKKIQENYSQFDLRHVKILLMKTLVRDSKLNKKGFQSTFTYKIVNQAKIE